MGEKPLEVPSSLSTGSLDKVAVGSSPTSNLQGPVHVMPVQMPRDHMAPAGVSEQCFGPIQVPKGARAIVGFAPVERWASFIIWWCLAPQQSRRRWFQNGTKAILRAELLPLAAMDSFVGGVARMCFIAGHGPTRKVLSHWTYLPES